MDEILEKPLLPETLLEPIGQFLAYITLEQGLANNTCDSYESDLSQCAHFLSKRGKMDWRTVEHEDISMWLCVLTERGYTVSTLSRKLSALRMFALYLYKEGARGDNFTELFQGPKRVRRLPNVLTVQEVEALIESPDLHSLQGIRDRAMLELLYSSGLRVSELCGLLLQSVDMDDGFLRVYGKGAKERVVPVGKMALEALANYLTSSRPAFVKTKTGSELFLSRLGVAISRKTVWLILKKYATLAGIKKNVKPHLLRHSFATHILANGGDLRVIQEMLGHADISTTEIYTSVEAGRTLSEHERCHPRAKQMDGQEFVLKKTT